MGIAVREFSPEEATSIGRAADRWNVFAGHGVVEVRLANDPYFCGFHKRTFAPASSRQAHRRSVTGNIEINPVWVCDEGWGTDPACMEAIIMHEMGHGLGLSHHDGRIEGVMRGYGGAALDFSEADRAQCESIGVCDPK